MATTTEIASTASAPRVKPTAACDVVMKGGITSGVIYPKALRLLGTHYRLQGLGGASAGAIGAALGAAAEFGRASGGFDVLDGLPAQLGEGKLADLFQPQPRTRKLLGLMLTSAGADGRSTVKGFHKVLRIIVKLIRSFPVAGLIGAIAGAACIVIGAANGGLAGWILFATGVLIAALGILVADIFCLYRIFTKDVPANMFGICTGLSTKAGSPGFTDWLSTQIDTIAGLQAPKADPGPPLTFGQLWTAGEVPDTDRQIDLRLITTCLNEGMPYELPLDARRFFFNKSDWEKLFPENVTKALVNAPAALAPDDDGDAQDWNWETKQAAAVGLVRLPAADSLPIIVAVRMSLSFPLLISAVPLYTINRRDPDNQKATRAFEQGDVQATLKFSRVWFTDGGFCSNFPVDLFDKALPTRPTFAINLGTFPDGEEPHPDDPTLDVEWAKSNKSGLLPQFTDIPSSGIGAIAGFGSAAFNTARNWHDTSYLNQPGHRDRIVRVKQTKLEGGLNLHMKGEVITLLANRGEAAGQVMYDQYNQVHYSNNGTGWDNQRWVRYRAMLSVLPGWIKTFQSGLSVLEINPHTPPSYKMSTQAETLAAAMTKHLSDLATTIDGVPTKVVDELTSQPNPRGFLRRIPRI